MSWRRYARSFAAVLLTIAAAIVGLALVGAISSVARWGPHHDPVALFGTYLLYATVFALPLLVIGLAAQWLAQILRTPRPAFDFVIWGAAGALLWRSVWSPMLDDIADMSPSAVNARDALIVGMGCALLGLATWFVEHRLLSRADAQE